ncbi:MAG: molybdopterin-guanine dinucleotide biosynthesis protein B [Ruminococcaceae bacterium]|nr:molybdopterin-guanine dinucleotide biosynthesis protein B [Oscillospiraceae bacterium]
MKIPVFTLAAYSGVGKTTYLEKLIPCLNAAGVRVAVIKHDCHGIALDADGKDTDRLARAGADPVAIASKAGFACFRSGELDLAACLSYIRDVDLILTEGFKQEACPKIALYRKASGQPLAVEPARCAAIVTDTPLEADCPQFPLDDPQPLADYLVNALHAAPKTAPRKGGLSVEDAAALALKHTRTLEEVMLPLPRALGCAAARDVFAPVMQPPFARSPLDGYAVRAADIAGASADTPVTLTVVDRIVAGDNAAVPVEAGQAVRLMTGCMIPPGADHIVRQEDTNLGGKTVKIFRSGAAYTNYCHAGEDYRQGEVLLPAGVKLDAAALAVAAGAGLTALPVIPRAKVALLATGNELQLPGEPLRPGCIYDSNTAYLTARLTRLGAEVTESRLMGDDRQGIADALRACLGSADIVISTGGVSVGEMDLMERAVLDVGAEILFHGVDVKPGMPTMLSVKDGTLILSLSGNPFAAAVPFELLLRPVLAKLCADPSLDLRCEMATAANGFGKASPTRRFLRGVVDEAGLVHIPAAQANGQMRSMIGCNCLIDIPGGSGEIRPGERLRILRL